MTTCPNCESVSEDTTPPISKQVYNDDELIAAYIGKNVEKIKNKKFSLGALYIWYILSYL